MPQAFLGELSPTLLTAQVGCEHQPLPAGATWADAPPRPLATPASHITTLTLGMTIVLRIEKSHAWTGGSDVGNGGIAFKSISRNLSAIHIPCKGYVKSLKSPSLIQTHRG